MLKAVVGGSASTILATGIGPLDWFPNISIMQQNAWIGNLIPSCCNSWGAWDSHFLMLPQLGAVWEARAGWWSPREALVLRPSTRRPRKPVASLP